MAADGGQRLGRRAFALGLLGAGGLVLAGCRRGQVARTGLPPTAAPAGPTPTPPPPPAIPPVPDPSRAAAFRGERLVYFGDAVGLAAELDRRLARQFSADTG